MPEVPAEKSKDDKFRAEYEEISPAPIRILPEPQLPKPEVHERYSPDKIPSIPKESRKEKNNYTQLSLLAEANSNFGFDTFGGAVGLRVSPFKDKNIGLGALLDVNFSLDKAIDSYTDSLSSGRTAYGTINDTNANSIGLLAELQYGPLFIGGGANYQNWITNTLEQILDASGNLVKSNINSTPNRQVFGKIYGGVEFPIRDVWKLGANVSYDGRNGAYFGVRNTFRLNKNREKWEKTTMQD